MKNPFRNIFNYSKNELQKSKKNKDETFKTDELINHNHLKDKVFEENAINQTKEFAIKQEENKIKKPMSDQEVKMRCNNLLRNLDNDFNFYNNSIAFSSIAGIKNFTEAMINKYFRSDYSDIGEKHINFAEYFIVKKLMARKDFELPEFQENELNLAFPNQGIDEKQNDDTHIRLIKTEIYKKRSNEMEELIKNFYKEDAKKAEEELNNYYGYNLKDFENTEEGSGANTPKASIIPKFIQRTAIVELTQ